MRRIVLDLQGGLLAEAVMQVLAGYDPDFIVYRSSKPEDTLALCRTCRANVLVMEVNRQGIWKLSERLRICRAVKKLGWDCKVLLLVDVKRVDGQFRLFAKGGREDTGIDAMDWAVKGVAAGAGEIVLNSIDTDGVKNGFDLEMLDALAARVSVPIIASGGAGDMEHFAELFTHPGVDAGLAASIFHTKQVDIKELKRFLRGKGVEMRI